MLVPLLSCEPCAPAEGADASWLKLVAPTEAAEGSAEVSLSWLVPVDVACVAVDEEVNVPETEFEASKSVLVVEGVELDSMEGSELFVALAASLGCEIDDVVAANDGSPPWFVAFELDAASPTGELPSDGCDVGAGDDAGANDPSDAVFSESVVAPLPELPFKSVWVVVALASGAASDFGSLAPVVAGLAAVSVALTGAAEALLAVVVSVAGLDTGCDDAPAPAVVALVSG